MNITLQVKNSIQKFNCPKHNLIQKDHSPQLINKAGIQQNENNKSPLPQNSKTLAVANPKLMRQSFLMHEFEDPTLYLQECMIKTKLQSLQPLKTPIVRVPLQKPINYLSKKTVNLKYTNEIQRPSMSVDVQKKSIILPKIDNKPLPPPPPVARRTKKKKQKTLKLAGRQNPTQVVSMPEIVLNTDNYELEEAEEIEQVNLDYLIRQEDL